MKPWFGNPVSKDNAMLWICYEKAAGGSSNDPCEGVWLLRRRWTVVALFGRLDGMK